MDALIKGLLLIDVVLLLSAILMLLVGLFCRLKFTYNFRFVSEKQREDTIKLCVRGLLLGVGIFIILKLLIYLRG